MLAYRIAVRLGLIKGALVCTLLCLLVSFAIYLAVSAATGVIRPFGIFMSLFTPMIGALPICIILLRMALELHDTKDKLIKAQECLEEKVAVRTRELRESGNLLKEEIEERKRTERHLEKSIADKMASEEMLRLSEGKYRTLLESINEGVFSIDAAGCFTYVNDKIVERSGLPREWFIGRSFIEVIHPEHRQFVQSKFDAGARGEAVPPFEVLLAYPGPSSRELWAEVSESLLYDGEKIVGSIGISRDITVRKQMEAELLKTRTLESIGTLAGGIAHDFNNLLMAVTGYISLSRLSLPPDSDGYKLLSKVEHVVLAGKDLTDKLITFSTGGAPIPTMLDLDKTIGESSSVALAGSNVKCLSLPSKDVFRVKADEMQIRQVIRNILINAKEAMPHGGTVRISTENKVISSEDNLPLLPGRYVMISIKDEGAGIRAEDIPKVFDPYFTTKDMGSEKGVGLGLAVAYSIMKRHRGHISVDSMPDSGTAVHLYLPAVHDEIEKAGHPSEP